MATTEKAVLKMPPTERPAVASTGNEFLLHADRRQPGLLREFWDFLRHNKAWWLTPIIAVLLMVGALFGLAATGVAPLLYAMW